ncbi:peptide/nickel transport system permease protein [Amycolatopsis sulphurea]|uniref:Peptide/nickel transport system permease protein n=1 Tax=Amycolatopsis sulphurea TaxID=76022 RepID=A0A2A9G2M6_9PSEU|nr:ABC transporter permease [Amycolatopsis sulphurea]PFG56995.1 peptide/nickel transport system permease protein [Amycolatopsis sulphurea]
MLRYVLLKLGRAVFVVWAAFTLTFILLFVLPANPVDLLFDPAELNSVPPEVRAQVADGYGFGEPVVVQYLDRLGHALRGDFGTSVQSGRSVSASIADVLPYTLLLAAGALVLAVLIAFGVAVVATSARRRWLRTLVESLPTAAVSIPVFLSGILLLQVFSFRLGWLPPFGDAGWQSLVLPLVTLAVPVAGPIAQLLVRSFATEFRAGYVTTGRAKGATRGRILTGEVFRNASLPALTIAGVTFGNLVAGSVITETVFARKGLGRMTQNAISTLDLPLVQGIVVFVAASFAVLNLVVDLAYPLLDPRLRAALTTGRTTAVAAERSIA